MVDEIDLKSYIKILKEKKWIVISFMVLSVFLGLIVSFLTKPVYSASAVVKVGRSFDQRSQEILDVSLKSDNILKETINDLGLNYSVEELRRKIKIRFTSVLVLTVFSEKSEEAARIANFLARKAVNLANQEGRVNSLTEEEKYLKEGIEVISKRIEEIEEDLKKARSEKATDSIERLTKISSISNMRSQLANLSNMKVARQRELSQIKFLIQKETAKLESLASTPTSPIKPNLKFNVVFSLLAGLIIGIIVAILMGEA
jgi:capsular polysaccharide biosynthesis protein